MNIDWINIIVGGLLGTLLGFLLVKISDWSRKARFHFSGFQECGVNFGTLYKINFTIEGCLDPGMSCIRITGKGYSTFAKWDETPSPLKDDKLGSFIAEMVPSTYYQPIFLKKEYSVPVIIQESDNDKKRFVFDGWWFGKDKGYFHGQELIEGDDVTLNILGGNGLNWIKTFKVKDIVSCG
ncbi:MAG: hypothetical protein NT060_01240 [Candidatus Omnitrophica bacterium]|nr:hypothetical protein [Candidatus Omnitrophota bacterium]